MSCAIVESQVPQHRQSLFAAVLPLNDPVSAAVAYWNSSALFRCVRGVVMGTGIDHRRCAEECVAMARLSEDDRDKALWLTLAQSWVRLAEHVAYAEAASAIEPAEDGASVRRQPTVRSV